MHRTRRIPFVLVVLATGIPMFMATLDNLVITNALPVIHARARRHRRGTAVVHQRVHAGVREPHPAGRRTGRPPRPPHDLHRRHRDLHRRLGLRRSQHRPDAADHRPRHPGHRRRRHHAALAVAAVRRRRVQAPPARDRHLGRPRRPRCRGRPAGRRRDRRGPELAVDLLDQRAGRHPGDPVRALGASQRVRRAGAARHPRRGARRARRARHRLRHRARQRRGLGLVRGARLARSAGPRCSPHSWSGRAGRRRRCCPCGCSATAASRSRTWSDSASASACSGRSSS